MIIQGNVYLQSDVAAFVNCAAVGCVAVSVGCVIAASVTKFCTDIGAKRPAAAAAAVSVCAPSPGMNAARMNSIDWR